MDDHELCDLLGRLLRVTKHTEVEVEARIRRQLVNKESVLRLLRDESFCWETCTYTERKRSAKTNRKCTYRHRCYANTFDIGIIKDEVICKSSLMKLDVNDKWCSVYVSTEKPIPSMSQSLEGVKTNMVTRHRGIVDTYYVDVTHSDEEIIRVEVEAKSSESFEYDRMIDVVSRVCHILQDSPCFMGYYDWCIAIHVVKSEYGSFCIDKGRYQKPNTMTMRDFAEVKANEGWAVTPKVDGVRRFILMINQKMFDVDISGNVRYMGESSSFDIMEERVTILDTEYVSGKYHVFDVVVLDGRFCGNEQDRFEKLEGILSEVDLVDAKIKPYENFDSFDGLARLYEGFLSDYDMDGLIFMNRSFSYMQPVFKWKMFPTVDLEIRGSMVFTSDNSQIDIEWEKPDDLEGADIWEFGYSRDADTLMPMKPRHDKTFANSLAIVQKTIMYAVPGSIFTGVGCYLMRKYHNRVKADAIKHANDDKATILDVGTGQGGDIYKWKRASKVYCVEPSEEATGEMIRRMGRDDKVRVFNVPLRDLDVDLVSDKIDIFTAFFCVNLFELSDWDKLKLIIKKKGSKKCRLLMIALTDPKTHDDDCFTLKMHGIDKYHIDIHGTRISGMTEKAVDPGHLKSVMSECRMEKVVQQRLNEETFMTANERELSSMYTLFVFKRSVF